MFLSRFTFRDFVTQDSMAGCVRVALYLVASLSQDAHIDRIAPLVVRVLYGSGGVVGFDNLGVPRRFPRLRIGKTLDHLSFLTACAPRSADLPPSCVKRILRAVLRNDV